MVAYSATIQLLIQLQEEIGVLLYSGEEDQLTKPFHLLPEFEWTVAKSATVATIQRMVAKMNGSTLPNAWQLTVAMVADSATIGGEW